MKKTNYKTSYLSYSRYPQDRTLKNIFDKKKQNIPCVN